MNKFYLPDLTKKFITKYKITYRNELSDTFKYQAGLYADDIIILTNSNQNVILIRKTNNELEHKLEW